ncbi:MAG TPA: primosomal protein N', partial [Thiolinea sp.]|nr:primosomal protein N' [Thiolinea sp.]
YQHAIGEVVFTALPNALRDGKPLPQTITWQALVKPEATTQLKRAKRQADLYQWLSEQGAPCSASAIHSHLGDGWR